MEFKAIFKLLAAPLLLGTAFAADGAAPSGYYQQAENKSGKNLLVALKGVISAHTTVSYKGLPDLYKTTDATANGKVWDMYSTKEWNFGAAIIRISAIAGTESTLFPKAGSTINRPCIPMLSTFTPPTAK